VRTLVVALESVEYEAYTPPVMLIRRVNSVYCSLTRDAQLRCCPYVCAKSGKLQPVDDDDDGAACTTMMTDVTASSSTVSDDVRTVT
jgi:hypothetical protein